MYRSRAIILSITKIRDNNTRIVMLSQDYGKITGWWNKKNITSIDIWDIIDVFISRENTKNIIKNIEIITPWWSRDWNYQQIFSFLETLHIISKISIDGNKCQSIYEDVSQFINYWLHQTLELCHYVIFQMRIIKSLGSMNPDILWDDKILQYIYTHISHTRLEKILSSSNIKNEHISKIQQINLHSIYLLNQ